MRRIGMNRNLIPMNIGILVIIISGQRDIM